MTRISIGCDHAGYEYKEIIKNMLIAGEYVVTDRGTNSTDSIDYPDYAHPVAQDVTGGEAMYGILICGSGNGVCMTANKYQNIRAAICWKEEIAELARLHNNANVICIPARFVSIEDAQKMVLKFLDTAFEGGRHEQRVNKISCN